MDSQSRVCKRCRVDKSIDEFRETRLTCKTCEHKRNKSHWSEPEGFFKYLLKSSQTNAKTRKLVHEITVQDLRDLYIEQGGRCGITGLPMTTEAAFMSNGRKGTNLSIDRIDVEVGYTKDNLVLVCQAVILMRQQLSYGDLRFWCELILDGQTPRRRE